MSSTTAALLLLTILVTALIALTAWGFLQSRGQQLAYVESHRDMLLWLLVLAAFALGAFVTYALLNIM